ncbi:MAG: FAD:protein transferase [Actinomycetota bacterium]|jgi:thiamine biosynthesis lipoprotein|nr:FAD:protein transferase [Actinomycetota bacterium]
MLHVEHVMGTVFTVAIRDAGSWADAIRDVVTWLHRVDALFSTYQPDSEISQIRAGQLSVEAADPLVQEVLTLCSAYEIETDGYFTAQLPTGLDPTGLVKGWAIERASRLLHEHGSHNHAVNGGGDVQLAGESSPGQPWRVGINDPHDRARVLTVVSGRDFAVATSGTYERGPHIVNPRTGAVASGLAGVSVIGPSVERADVYATAAVAMGSAAHTWLEGLPGHHGLLVYDDRTTARTSEFHLVDDT